jgi:regulator of sirC expression with transglutaminase-like and TPR domain
VDSVSSRLLSEGEEIIPLLEDYWLGNNDPIRAVRIEQIIRNIQTDSLSRDFQQWIQSENKDLLTACLLVSRIHYPGMDVSVVNNFIEKLRMDAWMALYNAGNPTDKVRILNHIFFERNGFKGNSEDYHHPDNSCINRVIETRSGNPISMCNLYSIVAQKLGIPLFGVNLPQHFVLAYCDDAGQNPIVPFQSPNSINRDDFGSSLFYVNAFSKGQIFLRRNIRDFLEVIRVEPSDNFFEPCNNLEILKRMLRNLHYSYGKTDDSHRRSLAEHYMAMLGMKDETGKSEEGQNDED